VFRRPNIPVYLDGVEPAMGTDQEGGEQLDTQLHFRIHPLSPELAGELDALVRATLWTIGKNDPSEKVKAITFELKQPGFQIVWRATPDTTRPTLAMPYAQLEKGIVHAKKHKNVAGWALSFRLRIPSPDADTLAFLHHGYTRQHFLTFEAAAPDLLSAMEGTAEGGPSPERRTDVH
jgi:hypothetical protein